MKSKPAMLHDVFVTNYAKGNGWLTPEQGAVLTVINEAGLGNVLTKPLSSQQFKTAMPEAKKMIEEQSNLLLTVVEKRKGERLIVAYRIAEFGDGKKIKASLTIKKRLVQGIVKNMKQTNEVVAKNTKLIADNQLNFLQLL